MGRRVTVVEFDGAFKTCDRLPAAIEAAQRQSHDVMRLGAVGVEGKRSRGDIARRGVFSCQ